MKKYQIRNVSDREIYDSYMGILRISPNPMGPSNDKLIDDPTQHLNSMLSIDVLNKTQSQMEIQLSDSDGNELPVVFIPKSRMTHFGYFVSESVLESKKLPIINMVTKIKDEANLYVSKSFKSYSTIYLDNTEDILSEKDLNENLNDIRRSPLQILSKTGIYENLVLYPVESPHDSDYFNDKNSLNIVDQSKTDRIKNREETLMSKSHDWYEKNIPANLDENGYEKSERVRVGDYYEEYFDVKDNTKKLRKGGGRYVTTHNNDGETIPVLYTRDYVLGHYNGHNTNVNNGIKDKWIGTKSSIHERNDLNQVTKLSWLRFDDLIWEVVDSALRGELRHTKGRYKKMGENEGDNVMDALFANGTSSLCDDSSLSESDILSKTAPMVAQGVQPGLIIYNAMSFQRYMFHLTRQICSNMDYQFNKYIFDKSQNFVSKGDDWNINLQNDEEKKWSDFNIQGRLIKNYKNQGLITPAPQGALSGVQNLSKNFAFCDGREVNYSNYPNLNISNDKIFELKGFLPKNYTSKDAREIVDEDYIIQERVWNEPEDDNYQLYNFVKKTPELYSLYESSPRFIRGLNWDIGKFNNIEVLKNDESVEYINKENVVDFRVGSDYKYSDQLSNNKTIVNINNTQIVIGEDGEFVDERTVGEEQSNVVKDINQVGLYFNNNDTMVRKNDHYHASFSSESGMNSTTDVKGERVNLTECVNYVSGRKDGAIKYYANHGGVLNNDLTSKRWLDYCFNKNQINKYDGYAPIPNGGLFLFNNQLFNPVDTSEYMGTSQAIEQEIRNGNYVYYDGENNEHKILPMTAPKDFSIRFLEELQKNELLGPIFAHTSLSDIVISNKYPFLDEIKINNIIEGGSENPTLCRIEMIDIFRNVFALHNEEKEKRHRQLIKINESEGRIPAASVGGPVYASHVTWSRLERRNISKKKRKAYSLVWIGVGNYKIGVNNDMLKKDDNVLTNNNREAEYKLRCLTSIPYQNSSKLGVGDVTLDIKSDFYSKNSITMQPSDIVYESVTYGGVDITKEKIKNDESGSTTEKVVGRMLRDAPTPAYVNLLPLLRI